MRPRDTLLIESAQFVLVMVKQPSEFVGGMLRRLPFDVRLAPCIWLLLLVLLPLSPAHALPLLLSDTVTMDQATREVLAVGGV